MKVINGKFNSAEVFTDNIEDSCTEQISQLLDQEAFKDAKVRIMPDCHAGAGCVIGFTADLGDKVIPNVVGVDIGCGMYTVDLGKVDIDFQKFDEIVRNNIPYGWNVHEGRIAKFPDIQQMRCYRNLRDSKKIERSLGTLGGGNHFIELDRDDDGNIYLVIHTGSRNLGTQVADHYQEDAVKLHSGWEEMWREQRRIIDEYKAAGRRNEIEGVLRQMRKDFKEKETDLPKDLCYLTGEYTQDYLHDMKICQDFAEKNRQLIAQIIIETYGLKARSSFSTVHNYIDHNSNIIRKGAVSAKKDEMLLIPINMRDGSLICIGKGNEDWNCSAPHGAGRVLSRTDARTNLKFEDFQKTMEEAGVFSTSVKPETIDESPMAYKGMEEIVENIGPTADIINIIKPIYNFKADH
jgi:RNA-splicing ligase RtcB